MNGDNDEAISEQVSNAWRVVGKRLLTEGYDPALVTETMLTVALKSSGWLANPSRCGVSTSLTRGSAGAGPGSAE